MRIILSFLILTFFAAPAQAQKEDKAIKAVINRFFEAMEKGDTALIRRTCTANPVFQTYMTDRQGQLNVITQDFEEFVRFVGTPKTDRYREEIRFGAIQYEAQLASVWTPYTFYVNGKPSHSGANSFQLVKTPEGWKIQYIIDTRRRS
jgi:hypothetical protein